MRLNRGTMISSGLLLAAFALPQLQPPPPAVPRRLLITRLGLAAPGDSLTYKLSWGRSARASGYATTVTAAPGTWAGLPTATVTTDTALTFTAVNALTDSVRFTASVLATNRWGASAAATRSWTLAADW